MGSRSLFQGTFPTQESNPGLPHCRLILYCLSQQGSQEQWSGQPILSLADLFDPGIEPGSSALQADSLPAKLQGNPNQIFTPEKNQETSKCCSSLSEEFPEPVMGSQWSLTACPAAALSSCPGDSHCWATDQKCSPSALDLPALVCWPLLMRASSHGRLQGGKPYEKTPLGYRSPDCTPREAVQSLRSPTCPPSQTSFSMGPWMAHPPRARVLAILHKGHPKVDLTHPPCVPRLGSEHQARGLLDPLNQRVPTPLPPHPTIGEAESYLGHSSKAPAGV